jgi:hypothetical protein
MSTAKVFNFNLNDEKRRMSVPELLKSSKRITEKRLHALMDTMFNNADDCLFEYADKAANNEQQTNYMDAMRELRLKKSNMQDAFFSDFDQQFAKHFSSEFSNTSFTSTQTPSDAGLSLVEEDDLEESLAITNMANRVYSEYREPLTAMILRMNEVYPAQVFSKDSNPLSPTIFCNAFSQSVACLSATLEIKLIVYKLFDKFVMRNIGQLYHEINEMFVAAGVLPTIKYKMPVVKASQSSVRAPQQESNAAPTPQAAQTSPQQIQQASLQQTPMAQMAPAPGFSQAPANVFDSMRQALYQYRGEPLPPSMHSGMHSGSAAPVSGPGAAMPAAMGQASLSPQSSQGAAVSSDNGEPGTSSGNGVYYVTSDIISGLSSMQNNTAFASFHAGTQNSGEVIKTKVLQAVTQGQDGKDEKTINNSDADVIDIVSMMFDYILNDKSLPQRTKTVIARLQIPMVKVAILDKAFFNKKTHPARALLNELAYASNVLDSEYDDADTLFQEVENVVERVLNEFNSNIELFSELLTEFLDFLATEVQANKLAEQMIVDAKQKVADEIEKRLLRHKVPPAVNRFIFGPWKDVMNTIGIRDQCEGIAWNTATTFLDDLIWSVQPKFFGSDRKQLGLLIPRILPSIREGMALLDDSDFDLPAFLQELQQIHLQALHVEKPHAKSSPQIAAQDDEVEHDAIMDDVLAHGNKHDSFEFDMNDPQLKQSPFFEVVRTMELGTWVEYESGQGKKRGKLTWKCDFTGEYTFMNRMYKVVADLSMRELITRLDAGSARIVSDTPLFDRAVNAIVSSMKQMAGGAGQTQPALN